MTSAWHQHDISTPVRFLASWLLSQRYWDRHLVFLENSEKLVENHITIRWSDEKFFFRGPSTKRATEPQFLTSLKHFKPSQHIRTGNNEVLIKDRIWAWLRGSTAPWHFLVLMDHPVSPTCRCSRPTCHNHLHWLRPTWRQPIIYLSVFNFNFLTSVTQTLPSSFFQRVNQIHSKFARLDLDRSTEFFISFFLFSLFILFLSCKKERVEKKNDEWARQRNAMERDC